MAQTADAAEAAEATPIRPVDPVEMAVEAKERRKSMRELPSLVGSSLTLMWRASRGRTLVTIGIQTITSLALFAQVLLIKQVLDAVLAVGEDGATVAAAVLPVALLAALTAATSIAGTVAALQQRVLGEMVSREVWRRVLDVSQSVDLSSYEDPDFYDQAQRVMTNAAQRTQIIVQALVLFIGGSLGMVAGTVAVLALAPALLPLLLLSGVPLFLTSRAAGRAEFAFAVQQSTRQRQRGYLQTVLTRRDEAKEVRAFSLADPLRRRWEDNYGTFVEHLQAHVRRLLRLALAGNLAAAVLTAATLMVALLLVDRGSLSIASAGAALVAVRLLGGRVSDAALGASSIYEAALFLADLRGFLGRRAEGITRRGTTIAPGSFERLALEDVTFTYPKASGPSVRGVSMELRRGQVVALVGANGSGKTTLAKLLADLYEPDEGAVRWDGVDMRTLDPDTVRRRIAVIFQDFVRYKLPARANVGLGRHDEDADDEAVREAAVQAGAHGFLEALPGGYDTILSKEYAGGVDLSLGQWQRVALARAFIRDAPFVILDEPSASLDARAEHELFQNIRTLLRGRTVLLVSHRFSTVRTADRIYVLSGGQIVEQGDHASLMREDGLYAELFSLQARAFLEGSPAGSPDVAGPAKARPADGVR